MFRVNYAGPVADAVDRNIEQWQAQRPELPLAAMATFARLGKVAALAAPAVEAVLADHGLTIGEFDVLAALRRAGAPHTLTPTVLARSLMLSPAAMTNRLDRLAAAGLVVRELDPGNRRSILVTLTGDGLARVDAAVTDHVANEERLLAGLTADQRAALDELLRTLLESWENGGGSVGRAG
jgi:DNA-binding MarR family transcriptional regulator